MVRGIVATLEPSCNRQQGRPADKGGCIPLLTAKYELDITLGGVFLHIDELL